EDQPLVRRDRQFVLPEAEMAAAGGGHDEGDEVVDVAFEHLDRQLPAIADMEQAEIAQAVMLEGRIDRHAAPGRPKPVRRDDSGNDVLDLVELGCAELAKLQG